MSYERRYCHRGRCAHLIPYYGDISETALCGVSVGDARYDWHGTGSHDEQERAAAMPLCARCVRISKSLAKALVGPAEANQPQPPAMPPRLDPERMLAASPDRLLTTAAVGALVGVNPSSVARWAKQRGVGPADRIQNGRSPITHWSERAIIEASLRKPARMRRRVT